LALWIARFFVQSQGTGACSTLRRLWARIRLAILPRVAIRHVSCAARV